MRQRRSCENCTGNLLPHPLRGNEHSCMAVMACPRKARMTARLLVGAPPHWHSARPVFIDGSRAIRDGSASVGRPEMPYAVNAGVRIHYKVEGAGPDLVLQHGFMGSLEDWSACGYVAALPANYRLIFID